LHWGRAFEILSLRSSGFGVGWHGYVLGRKRDVALTRDDLERPEPEDPRELQAQRQQLVVLEEEAVEMRERWERERSNAERLRLMRSREASPRWNPLRQILRKVLRSQ
jgi:hypothetical protein